MKNKLQHRLLTGFAAQGFGQLVNLVIQVFSVPLYLHYWGKVHYGEWLLLSSVLGYLSMSDLSFGNAAQNEMAVRVGRDDRQGALSVFQSCWLLITTVSLVAMLLSMVVISFMPLEIWLKLKPMSHRDTVTIIYLLILQVILAQQGGLLTAGFRCDGNLARGVMLANWLRLAEFGTSAIVVFYHGGMQGVALVILLTRIVGYLVLYRQLRRCTPWLYGGWQHYSFAIIRPLIGPAISYNAFPLGYALSLQGVLTVVGVYLGPGAVTLFSTSRTLTRIVWQMLTAIANTVWVEFSAAFGTHDLLLARTLHRRACQVAFWIALIATGALAIFGGPIYHIWTHGKVQFDPVLFNLLLLVVVGSSLWSTSYTVPLSINKHQRIAVVFLGGTALSLVLAALFMRAWGLHGAAIALLAPEILMNIYVIRFSLALLQDDPRGYLRVVLTPPIGWLRAKLAMARP